MVVGRGKRYFMHVETCESNIYGKNLVSETIEWYVSSVMGRVHRHNYYSTNLTQIHHSVYPLFMKS